MLIINNRNLFPLSRLLAQIFAGGGVVVKAEEKGLDAYDLLKKETEEEKADGEGEVEERGVPEGQEDPVSFSETETLRSRRSNSSKCDMSVSGEETG